MKTEKLSRISRLLRYALVAGAVLYLVAYLVLVYYRIQYPFELEWIEGGSVDHVRRLLAGQKLYGRPSLEFVPFIYTPLYYYCSAAVTKMTGVGFLPLRLVSFVSSLGCFLFIFLIVSRETKNRFAGVLASCLFAATFRIGGAWFDIARVDSLFLLFLLIAFYHILSPASLKSSVLAGVFFCLSFLTKQTALIISLPIMLYCLLVNYRQAVGFIGTIVVTVGVGCLLLDYLHDGWFYYYIYELPGQHPFAASMFVLFWGSDLLAPLSIACIMSILFMHHQFSSGAKSRGLLYLLVLAGTIGGTWLSRVHEGGYNNVLFPAYAVLSILFGLAIHSALKFCKSLSPDKRKVAETYLYLFCILQFVALAYNPIQQIPTPKDLAAGQTLIDKMASVEGEVLIPCHGFLPAMAGKRSYAHEMAIRDVLRGDPNHAGARLTDEIRQAIEQKRFGAIILDWDWFIEDIEKRYTRQGPLLDQGIFVPVTGARVRPEFIYLPKEP